MSTTATSIEALANQEYKWGFVTEIEADAISGQRHNDRFTFSRLLKALGCGLEEVP